MSQRKKTLDEIQKELARAQARVETLRKKEKEATKAQEAAEKEELLKAVLMWVRATGKTIPEATQALKHSAEKIAQERQTQFAAGIGRQPDGTRTNP